MTSLGRRANRRTNLRKFFGFNYYVDTDVDLDAYRRLASRIEERAADLLSESERELCDAYLAKIKIQMTSRNHWGVRELRDRIRDFKLTAWIPDSLQGKMRFINKQINPFSLWLLTSNMDVSAKSGEISCWFNNAWFEPLERIDDAYKAEILLVAIVDRSLMPRKRKIKFRGVARPSAKFAQKFKVANPDDLSFISHSTYFLDKGNQLPLFRKNGRS